MQHDHAERTGEVWRYLIYGDGQWMPRWHCTGGDIWLFAVMATCVTLMVAEYFLYAYHTYESLRLRPSIHDRTHRLRLLRVFVACGTLHLAGVYLSWCWTPYYLIAAGYAANAFQMRLLNRSKVSLLAEQEREAREKTIASYEKIKELSATEFSSTTERLKAMIIELERHAGAVMELSSDGRDTGTG